MRIEVLGTGCPKCLKLEENARKAAEEAGVDVEVVKVTDMDKILSYGVMMTPALVLDGQVKCSGKIAGVDEIKSWMRGVKSDE